MSCTEYRPSLSELVDGTLTGGARTSIESHLESCASCRAVLADLRRLREASRALPRMTPPEALWQKVRAAVDLEAAAASSLAREAPDGRRVTAWTRKLATPLPWPAWGTLAAAAVLVLAVSAGLFYYLRPAPKVQQAAAHPAAAQTVQSIEADLDVAQEHYMKAIAALQQVAKDGRAALDPQTVAVLDKSNVVIDQAIQESQAAVRAQPASEQARASLFEALQRKVSLLRDTVALINEMRKGDQAGAAQVVGSLGKS
jgi:anti-sigma factor RsiW